MVEAKGRGDWRLDKGVVQFAEALVGQGVEQGVARACARFGSSKKRVGVEQAVENG